MLVIPRAVTYVAAAPLAFAGTVLAGVAVVAARVTLLGSLALAIDRALIQARPFAEVTPLLVVASAAGLAELGIRVLGALAAARLSTRVLGQVRARLVAALVELGPGWLRGQRAGRVQATVGDGVEALQGYVSAYLPQLAVATIAPTVLVLLGIVIDPPAGLAAGIAAVLLPLSKPLWTRLVGDRSRAHWEAYATLSARMQEALAGMPTLRLLDATGDRRAEIARDTERLKRENRSGLAISLIAYCLATVAVGLGTVVVTVLAGLGLVSGRIGPLTALVLVLGVAEVFRPLLELESFWSAGFRGRAAAEAIDEILGAPRPLVEAAGTGVVSGGRSPSLASLGGPAVRFERVSFTHPGSAAAALVDIDLDIAPGETLALVGRSGAGKSTLVHLLQRWYDPDQGRVLVNGQDIATIELTDHRHRIAVVSQDVHLLGSTIRDHLLLARPDAEDAMLLDVLHRARALDVVAGLPDGIDTPLGERGARLSGGERQRIAIATAFLSGAPLLVLDEATSALDGRTEAAVMEAVADLRQGRTTLLIAHRLSTAAGADRIAVLEAGRLLEVGTPTALARSGGRLADLVAAQVVFA